MTHEVFNQPPPLAGHDVAADDALLAAVAREGAGWAVDDLHRLGTLAGTAGHTCPISMTYAVVPALRHDADLAAAYEPLLTARD